MERLSWLLVFVLRLPEAHPDRADLLEELSEALAHVHREHVRREGCCCGGETSP